MNKTISLIAIVTGLVLTSCGSLQTISFEQFQEGELSVLHDEISKMTRRLIEQAEALKIEKGNLADALADI